MDAVAIAQRQALFIAALQPALLPLQSNLGATAKRIESLLQNAPNSSSALWEVAKELGAWANAAPRTQTETGAAFDLITRIREFQGELAEKSTEPALVVFGTSGWRDTIGGGFTVLNVRKVVRAIGEMMRTPEYAEANQLADVAAVQRAGVLLFRDNRYMGEPFLKVAHQELGALGFKLYDVGMCPTGVGSALVRLLKAAGSINFTPSHNPMEYAGIKFNPADGGPADIEWTTRIEQGAEKYMQAKALFSPATADPSVKVQQVMGAEMFKKFVEEHSVVFDLPAIRNFLQHQAKRLCLVVDFMHGASRGYIETLLGEGLIASLEASGSLVRINTQEDYSFHGVKPEPSAYNQKPLIERLKASGRELTLAVALDPDADRIRFADDQMDCDMNRFAAIAFAHFAGKGIAGGLATSVPSSGFPAAIARSMGREVTETAVGFKHFRASLSSGKTLMAFEESDGISFRGHTLEKCALAGFLAALQILADTEQTLSKLYLELQTKHGRYYPGKGGVELSGITVEAWQTVKGQVMHILTGGLVKTGQMLAVGGVTRKVTQVITVDGLKVVFDDGSWLLLRASGTEPKFRTYWEWVDKTGDADAKSMDAAYADCGNTLLNAARARIPKP